MGLTIDIEMGISNDVKLISLPSPSGDVHFGKIDADVQQARRRGQVVQLKLCDIKHRPALFFYAFACFGNLHLLADYKHVVKTHAFGVNTENEHACSAKHRNGWPNLNLT